MAGIRIQDPMASILYRIVAIENYTSYEIKFSSSYVKLQLVNHIQLANHKQRLLLYTQLKNSGANGSLQGEIYEALCHAAFSENISLSMVKLGGVPVIADASRTMKVSEFMKKKKNLSYAMTSTLKRRLHSNISSLEDSCTQLLSDLKSLLSDNNQQTTSDPYILETVGAVTVDTFVNIEEVTSKINNLPKTDEKQSLYLIPTRKNQETYDAILVNIERSVTKIFLIQMTIMDHHTFDSTVVKDVQEKLCSNASPVSEDSGACNDGVFEKAKIPLNFVFVLPDYRADKFRRQNCKKNLKDTTDQYKVTLDFE